MIAIKKLIVVILSICLFIVFLGNTYAYNEAVIDVTTMSIEEIQKAVDDGLLSYELLARLYLDRINTYNDTFNAMISVNENIIDEAINCDLIYKESGRTSLLFGIPIIVKDNIDVYGLATTDGTLSLKDNYPNSDSEVVAKLKEQGALIIGKSNMSEFAFLASTSESSYGMVHNAYNLDYTSFGSSGGSAVAVSLAFAPIALGTDTNLSVRFPASAANLYGMRPTFGLLSNDGVITYDKTRDTIGILSKYASDNLLLFNSLSDNNVSTSTNYTIGVLDQFIEGDSTSYLSATDSEIKDLFNNQIDLLAANGVNIIHIDDFYKSSFTDIYVDTISGYTMCDSFNNYITNTTGSIRSFYDLTVSPSHIYSLWDYYPDCGTSSSTSKTSSIKEPFKKALDDLFKEYDLDALVFPTSNAKISTIDNVLVSTNIDYLSPVLGLPDISVPMGEIDGLYYGMDIVGLANTDSLIYEIANLYDSIDESFTLSPLAPNLYSIPPEVENLRDYYLENKDNKTEETIDITSQVKNFFLNYNSYDDKAETAYNLYEKYEFIINQSKESSLSNSSLLSNFLIIISILICFIVLTIILRKRRKH